MGKIIEKKITHDSNLASEFIKKFEDGTKKYPDTFISFMQRCWAYDPKERPSFQEIIEKIKGAKKELITRSLERPLSCDLGVEQAKHQRLETKSSKHGIRSQLTKAGRKLRDKLAPTRRNNQVSKGPIPPPNPQLLMSSLMGHTQYVDIIALVFKVIPASWSL